MNPLGRGQGIIGRGAKLTILASSNILRGALPPKHGLRQRSIMLFRTDRGNRFAVLALALFLASAFASCGDDAPVGPGDFPDVRGDWTGQYSVTQCEALTGIDPFFCTDVFYEGRSLTLELQLNQSNERVSGNALQGSIGGQVSGTVTDAGLVSLLGQLGASADATTTIEAWVTQLSGDSLDGSWQFLVEDNLDQGFGSARVNAEMILVNRNVPGFFGCPVQAWLSQTDSISGVLEDGDCMLDDESFYDVYAVDVEVGDSVEFRIASTDYDPFIIVSQEDNNPITADGGLGQASASVGALARDNETWLIVANSWLANQSGSYSLVATKINGTTSPGVALQRVSVESRPGSLKPGSIRELLSGTFVGRRAPAAALKRKDLD